MLKYVHDISKKEYSPERGEGSSADFDGLSAERLGTDELLALSDEYRKEIGSLAESFVYATLEKQLAAESVPFGPEGWVSTFRQDVFPDCKAPIKNDAGYDITYTDRTGRTIYIEVKGSVLQVPTFFLSENEWRVAQGCRSPKGPEYVIYYVSIYPQPRILHKLRDPHTLNQQGLLLLEPLSYKVTIQLDKLRSEPPAAKQTISGVALLSFFNGVGTQNPSSSLAPPAHLPSSPKTPVKTNQNGQQQSPSGSAAKKGQSNTSRQQTQRRQYKPKVLSTNPLDKATLTLQSEAAKTPK